MMDLTKVIELSRQAAAAAEVPNVNPYSLEPLTIQLIVIYARCFNSKFNMSPPLTGVSDVLPQDSDENTITEKEMHTILLSYRDKHVAHSDDFLKAYDVGGLRLNDGTIGIVPLVATRICAEDKHFYQSVGILSKKLLENCKSRQARTLKRIVELVQTGECKITDEGMMITPLPENKSSRELWQLPPRKI